MKSILASAISFRLVAIDVKIMAPIADRRLNKVDGIVLLIRFVLS